MQESMVKFVLIVLALLALAIGGVFLIIPGGFVTVAVVEHANIAWLRAIGASIVTVQGLGLGFTAVRRRETNSTLGLISVATTVETGFVWYSLIAGEFAGQALWTVIVPGIVATAAVIVLWASWLSRRKSSGSLPPRAKRAPDAKGAALEEAPVPEYEPETAAPIRDDEPQA